jgi:hypothetical protein
MRYRDYMERVINLHVEHLPDGVWPGASDDIQGLVVQGHTVGETVRIALDVAEKLAELQHINDSISMRLVSTSPVRNA